MVEVLNGLKGCKCCEEAKKAFILINRASFKNVSVMCNWCWKIWSAKKVD